MKARRIATAAGLAVVLGAGPASAAEGIAGRFAIAAQVGTQSEIGGDLVRSGQGTVSVFPVTFESVSYRNVYEPKVRVQGLLGYGVSEKVEIVLRGGWYESEGAGVDAGGFANGDLFAYFSDYEEWGIEVAARYYLSHRSRLKSYIAPVAGLRSTNAVYTDFNLPAVGSAVLNVPFSDETTVPVFGLDIGVSFDLTENLFLALDSGIRWQGASSDANALPSLSAIDDSEGRWTAPVLFSLGVRF